MKLPKKTTILSCRLRHAKNFLQVLNRRGLRLDIKPRSVLNKHAFLEGQRRLMCLDPAHY